MVGALALAEDVDARLDRHLAAAVEQLVQLVVGEAVEQAEGAEIGDAHQIVAR